MSNRACPPRIAPVLPESPVPTGSTGAADRGTFAVKSLNRSDFLAYEQSAVGWLLAGPDAAFLPFPALGKGGQRLGRPLVIPRFSEGFLS